MKYPRSTLGGIDLNHLRALHILLDESNVGKAAARLNITAPAASNALRRLRTMFGDKLLVRSGRSMVRTAKGEALRKHAAEFVHAAEALFLHSRSRDSDSGSDSVAWRGSFRIMTSNYVYLALADSLETSLASHASGLSIHLAPMSDAASWLRQNDGLAIAPFVLPNRDVLSERLFVDEMVVVMRKSHALARSTLTLDRYCQLSHVLVAPHGQPGSPVDTLLSKKGRSRNVTRVVPSHTLAAFMVARSDAIALLPSRLFGSVHTRLGLISKPPPFEFPPFEFRLHWHLRHDESPIHLFMRSLLRKAAGSEI